MNTPCCACEFETVSEPVAGVLHCAVCKLPKSRAGAPERLLPYPEAALAIGIPLKTLRALVATGSIKPAVQTHSCVRFYPAHIRAQLSQKGIKPR